VDRERSLLPGPARQEHAHDIVFAASALLARRHATVVAATVLVLSVAGTAAALTGTRVIEDSPNVGQGDLVYIACQILPYGVVGAVLVARRPDLPFGWLLSLAAMCLVAVLAVTGPSLLALEHGHGGQLAVWGLTAGSLMFVPAAIEGLVNVRFPSGTPSGRGGRLLERAIVVGIVVGLLSGLLGDSVVRAVRAGGGPTRFIDGTPVVAIGNALVVAVPLVILLGVLAGIGVILRYVRSEGLERLQLRWRAAGALSALALFPLAVTEHLPEAVGDAEPLVFVATLVIPVLRYDLWAIDSIVRRSASYTFASSGASSGDTLDSMVRATGEMLGLPHVALHQGDRTLASYGEARDEVCAWPLVHEGEQVGELVASPRHGFTDFSEPDGEVLATVARIVAGSVRAETLTTDLLAARHRLVAAREEERRRLRRDLHDGLGPLLTGLGLNLDAATAQLGRSEDKTAAYLGHAKDASRQVMTGLRDLVEGLRPPALDELGLAGALKLQIDRLASDAGLRADLRAPADLDLPAAVEVAAYRTAVEGVTNVARHSDAGSVCVELAVEQDDLVVRVSDDGSGRAAWLPGQGLLGMRERAEELGGTFRAGPTPQGGLVTVTIPLGVGR
jgi:signal transduction histidine kinase